MKNIVTILVTVLVVVLAAYGIKSLMGEKKAVDPMTAVVGEASPEKDLNKPPADLVMGDPLDGSGLKFDGVYRAQVGDANYYMRFFPAGHVAMIGGPEQKKGYSLRTALTASVLGQRNIGLYNVPVQWRGDSLHIITKGTKGDILYSCKVETPEKLMVLKESKANGKKAVLDYQFEVDGTPF